MGTEKRERQRANRQLKYQQQVKQVRRSTLTRRVVIGVIAVVGGLAVVVVLAWLGGSGGDDKPRATSDPAATGFSYGSGECPPAEVTEPVRTFADAPQLCIDPDASYTARFSTSEGEIVVDLDTAARPGTVNNFVTLARYGYYDDTLIFRADRSIDIIQGGGRTNTDSPGYNIPDEGSDFTYEPGQLVMARSQGLDSAGGQFFFVTGPQASALDAAGTYVVFGTITEGLDVARAILELAPEGSQSPTPEVVVESVEITEG